VNKFGKLRIRNRIEYVICYLFLVNIIGNCHENKYIEYIVMRKMIFSSENPPKK
jgi:hypothetical protein